MFHAVTIEHLGFPCSSAGRESACNAGDLGSIPESGNSPREGIVYPLLYSWASLVAQMVKNPPAMWETWVPSLGWEDMLEEGIATHSSILAWRIPMGRGAWLATVHGVAKRSQRVGHDWATKHIEHLVLGRPLHQIMGEEITQWSLYPGMKSSSLSLDTQRMYCQQFSQGTGLKGQEILLQNYPN